MGEVVDREGSGGCLAEGEGEEVAMEEEAAVGDDGRSSRLRDSLSSGFFLFLPFFQPFHLFVSFSFAFESLSVCRLSLQRVHRLSLRAF